MLVTIGRDASCNFVIDSPRVSGSHCQIRFMADRFEVTDLGSSNGTFVGVERTRVQAPTTVFPGQPLFLGTIEVSPTEVAGRFGLQWPAAVPAAAPRASGAGLIVVGRDGSCDFVIDSPKISGRHCQLRFAGDRVEVTDLGSSNGTFVGDDRVRVQGTVAVFPGQSVFMSTVPLPIEEIARRNGFTWAAAGRPAPATVMDSQPSGAEVARLAAERAALEQERMRLEQARLLAAAPRVAAPIEVPQHAVSTEEARKKAGAALSAVGLVLAVCAGILAGGLYYLSRPSEMMNETRELNEGDYTSLHLVSAGPREVTVSVSAQPKSVDVFLLDDENFALFRKSFDEGNTGGFDFYRALSSKDVLQNEQTARLVPGSWTLVVQRPQESVLAREPTTVHVRITGRLDLLP